MPPDIQSASNDGSLEGTRESFVILEADLERNFEDAVVRHGQVICGAFQTEAVDVLLWRLSDCIREEAMEMVRRIAVLVCERFQAELAVQVMLDLDEKGNQIVHGQDRGVHDGLTSDTSALPAHASEFRPRTGSKAF